MLARKYDLQPEIQQCDIIPASHPEPEENGRQVGFLSLFIKFKV